MITAEYPEWKLKILELANYFQPVSFIEKSFNNSIIKKNRKYVEQEVEQAKIKQARKQIIRLLEKAQSIAQEYQTVEFDDMDKNLDHC